MKIITQLLLGFILASSWGFSKSPMSSTANRQLRAVTNDLTGESGKAIQLWEISAHGLQGFPQWYTQSSVQALAANWAPVLYQYPIGSLTSPANAVSLPIPATIALVTAVSDPAADLIGPNQIYQNAVQTFEVNPNRLANATNFSWWNTGSTKSITVIQPGKTSIDFGPSYVGGQVCVGINYSVSPRYKQYCKDVSPRSPEVALTSPTTSATFANAATIALAANASDAGHNIARIEYFNGLAKLGESTEFPYSVSWPDVVAGTYTLTAKATDKLGLTTTSAPVTIQVKSPASSSTDDVVNALVFPNPTHDQFSFIAAHDIQSITVLDQLGREQLKLGAAKVGQTVSFGENLSFGTYLLHIQYSTQNQRVVKLLKTDY